MMTNPMKGAPSMWIPYVDVSDIESSTTEGEGARREHPPRRHAGGPTWGG